MATDEPLDLATLIRREQDRTGASYADIARTAGLSKAKIGQLAARDTKHQVRADTLRKLAIGLRLPYNVVQRAALVSSGVVDAVIDGQDDRITLIVAELEKLNSADLDLVASLIAAVVAQRG